MRTTFCFTWGISSPLLVQQWPLLKNLVIGLDCGSIVTRSSSPWIPTQPLPVKAAQLQVSEFQYLGIKFSTCPQEFIALNISPLLIQIANKIGTWCRLPLSVIGRGNLIKMVLMPQILYVLHNSPIWILMYIIHKIHCLFKNYYGRKHMPESSLLHFNRTMMPFLMYGFNFVASQLQHFTSWVGRGEVKPA